MIASTRMVRAFYLTVLIVAGMFLRSSGASEPEQKYPPTIVFMTDFGVVDDSVAIVPRCDVFGYAGRAHRRSDARGYAIFDSRRSPFSLWRDAVLSGGHGVCGGDRSGCGQQRARRSWRIRSAGNTSFCRTTGC